MGARDMSTIETPPPNRVPVATTVCAYDERVIRDAIRREMKRGGQVFFLHNRVSSIETMAERLKTLVPHARLVIGHGQMPSDDLEEVMTRFVEGKADVLLSTTIIESGIDIPNANTIIIDRADRFGLSDLYQLRGRVGRYKHQAYAYFMLPRHAGLLADARKRIGAIRQYSSLGSGFKIAMRDLEIRGAGNLLGESQSGHIAAVGYDLYCQMVTEAVSEMKGEPQPEAPAEIKLDVPTDAYLPTDYVEKEELRLEAYRRLAAVTSAAEVDDIRTEWEDRYGPLPEPAVALLHVGYLRAECHRLSINDIQISGSASTGGTAKLAPLELKLSETMRLRRISKGAKYKEDLGQLVVPLPRGADASTFLASFLRDLVPAE
jgi:transcription-repair coupling factor (superfamily II helicase)